METSFGASAPYTVGIEEEFQLIDPGTLGLAPLISDVLAARRPGEEDLVTSELSSACLETRSPVYGNISELAAGLPELRRRVKALAERGGARLAASGTHPFSDPSDGPVSEGEHYRRVEEEMGWVARTQAIYGLHVHVAVRDEEAAIRAVGILAKHVPLLIALSANSPFWRGHDTRLASTRIKIFDLFPRSGLPPAFRTWGEFEGHVEKLVAAGSIPDYTWCWWDVRPHPRFGTVEVRVLDAQTDPSRTTALAALIQCLVAGAAGETAAPEDPLLLSENKWRATRYGLDATFHDFASGRSAKAREAARTLVEGLRPVGQDLECEDELASVLEILDQGSGTDRQRAVLREVGSLKGVAEDLIRRTA
ncbi:MAG: glutamate--cysteine ligase [Actinomycetota bacterium]|nr:glutamate--cysteine ligase [Actinomycetota bacterium]